MTYRVTAIGPDWVEIWDSETMTDPDWPGEKHTTPVRVGEPHPFLVDDFVDLSLRLVARITPPPDDDDAGVSSGLGTER